MHAKQTKITIYDIPCFLSNINDFEILVLHQRMPNVNAKIFTNPSIK